MHRHPHTASQLIIVTVQTMMRHVMSAHINTHLSAKLLSAQVASHRLSNMWINHCSNYSDQSLVCPGYSSQYQVSRCCIIKRATCQCSPEQTRKNSCGNGDKLLFGAEVYLFSRRCLKSKARLRAVWPRRSFKC